MIARWPRPDFLSEASSTRPAWVVWWTAGAVLVALTTAVDAWSTLREVQDQRTRLARATQLAQRRAPPRPSAGASEPGAGKPEADAARAARRVMDRLRYPWAGIVADLEARTPAGLQWLAIDHDSQTPQLRLEGSALDIAGALRVVDDLAGRPGWSDVMLSQLQPPDPRAGTPAAAAWHFELTAVVDPQRVGTAPVAVR